MVNVNNHPVGNNINLHTKKQIIFQFDPVIDVHVGRYSLGYFLYIYTL